MRGARLLFWLLIVVGLCSPMVFQPPPERVREIKIAVLNDVEEPVNPLIIYLTLFKVFDEYRREVGIEFQIDGPILPYEGDLTDWPIDQAVYLSEIVPQTSELQLVFTGYEVLRDDMSAPNEVKDDTEFGGSSEVESGFSLIFSAESRFFDSDRGGHNALETIIKHELAHQFRAAHSSDPRSFMYPVPCTSLGYWTAEVKQQIREKKDYKTWLNWWWMKNNR